MKTLEIDTLAGWRRWLARHRDSESEVWLVFPRRHTGRAGIPYEAAVEEALCHGWIDSLVRRLDEDRYARKFTPRRPGSRWSALNRERAERLIAEGRMTAAGLRLVEAARESGAWERQDPPPGRRTGMPAELVAALAASPRARRTFESLPPSQRRLYAGWIAAARRPQTRRRRTEEAIGKLERGERLGLK